MNRDEDELEKFNAFSPGWWDPEGPLRPLHAMNPVRLAWILEQTPLEGKKVLDIGCGGGILSEVLAKAGALVTGIDLAEEALSAARAHAAASGLDIRYLASSAEELANRTPEAYDTVTCLELLEHVPDVFSVVRAASALLKPGGTAVFSTVNRNMKSLLYAIIGAEYVMRLLPKGTHDFSKFITPAELARDARMAGLTVTAVTGIGCDITARRFYLDTNTQVNYMLAAKKE